MNRRGSDFSGLAAIAPDLRNRAGNSCLRQSVDQISELGAPALGKIGAARTQFGTTVDFVGDNRVIFNLAATNID